MSGNSYGHVRIRVQGATATGASSTVSLPLLGWIECLKVMSERELRRLVRSIATELIESRDYTGFLSAAIRARLYAQLGVTA